MCACALFPLADIVGQAYSVCEFANKTPEVFAMAKPPIGEDGEEKPILLSNILAYLGTEGS